MRVDRLSADTGDVTLAYRRAIVHPPAAPSAPPPGVPEQRAAGTPAARPAAQSETRDTTDTERDRRPAPPMPNLSPGDRAAVASVTGFYLSPTGEVTPEGNPPWSFIIQYVANRRAELADVRATDAQATDAKATDAQPTDAAGGTNLDITV